MCLVLLPGTDGTGELFAEFARELPFKSSIVNYPRERFLSYAELEPRVHDACAGQGPFVLVAESFSTPLAILYAATMPANLRGLVLCAGFTAPPLRGPLASLVSAISPLLARLPLPGFVIRFWLIGKNAPSTLQAALKRAIASVRPGVLAARLKATLRCDVRPELTRIDVPILYIQSKNDRIIRPSCGEEIQRHNPRAAIVTVEGPHLLLQTEPGITAAIVTDFIMHSVL